jgi:ABC-type dipeptide/oligopeptide/nickel transport system permease component
LKQFVLQRFLRLVVVVLGVSLLTFSLVHLTGDPVLLMLPPEASDTEVEQFRKVMGFDRPLPVQYFSFVAKAAVGDFGRSLKHQRPAFDVVMERLPGTAKLSVVAMLVSVLVAVPAGIMAAVKRRSPLDSFYTTLALLGQSIPIFWTGILLMLLFGVHWRILPVSGWGTWKHMVMPAIALGVWTAPVLVRLVRSAMIDVLTADYIRTARAKGLNERRIIYKHAVRNAAVPIITMMGIQFGRLLGGSVITESVFAVPGLGRATVQAIYNSDFPLVQASVLFLSLVIVILNFLVDVAYAWINPQIRYA